MEANLSRSVCRYDVIDEPAGKHLVMECVPPRPPPAPTVAVLTARVLGVPSVRAQAGLGAAPAARARQRRPMAKAALRTDGKRRTRCAATLREKA